MSKKRKLGRGVAMVGAGMSAFNMFKDRDSKDLFAEAFVGMSASVDKGLDPNDIDALYIGNFTNDFSHISRIGAQFFRIPLALFPNPPHGLRALVLQVHLLFGRVSLLSPPASTMWSWSVGSRICPKAPPKRSPRAWLWRRFLTNERQVLHSQGFSGQSLRHILRDMVPPAKT